MTSKLASSSQRTQVVRALGILLAVVLLAVGACTPTPPPSNDPEPVWRTAFNTRETGALSAVWGTGPDNVFVVGGLPNQGEVYHFDGTDWRFMEIPEVPLLVWVYGFGPDDVIAVGEGGGAIRYDGESWTLLETPTTEDLWGVWGSGPEDIWIVGGTVDFGLPLILRYNGVFFESVAIPENDRGATSLFKVWGIGSKVFAVGENGLIIEYVNDEWTQVPTGAAADDDFVSLWGTSEDNIVAVGGRSSARIAHYDGTSWTTQSLASVPGLLGVFMDDPGQAIITGTNGYVGRYDPVAGLLEAEESASNLCLHAAWGDGAGVYYGVGGRFSVPYAGAATFREIGDPDEDPGPAPLPIRSCDTVEDCGNNQVCESNRCQHEDACEEDADCSDGEVCRNTLCAPALCSGDGDCAGDLVCIQGQCAAEGTGTCTSEPDCELGETCTAGLCSETDDPDIQYWVRTGAAEPGPVADGGTIPFFSGFQGGMHTFVTIRATGFPPDAFTSVTISIEAIESETAIVAERTYPATFSEVSPGVNELDDLFVIFSRTPEGGPDGVEVEVNITVTDGDDSSITASLMQTAVFGPAQ